MISSPGWGDLGSGGNRRRALGVHICAQGGADIAQSRCCYESSPLVSTDLGARTLGLCSGSTEGPSPCGDRGPGVPCPLLQAVQSIGNLGQQLGQGKEVWMAPLHPFLLRSVSRVRDFLDRLVDVDEEEGEFLCPCHSQPVTPLDALGLPPRPQH